MRLLGDANFGYVPHSRLMLLLESSTCGERQL